MAGTSRASLSWLLLGLISLAACSGGGGGGDSGSAGGVVTGGGGGTISATIGWAEATGPVEGYRVLVSRNGTLFRASGDVTSPSATITGVVGDRVRIRVAAVDVDGVLGPLSPPSDEIVFTEAGAVLAAASASEPASGGGSVARGSASAPPEAADEGPEIVPPEEKTRHDFDADGASDLLWEAAPPGAAMRFTSLREGALRTDLSFDRPAGGWWVAGIEDVNGDARADLLWVDEAGMLAVTDGALLRNTAPTVPLAMVGELGADEDVIATGDFDADGLGDLLVEDAATGARFVWLHAGEGAEVLELNVATEAGSRLTATGDFDADGRTDLLFQSAGGTHSLYFMNGASADAELEFAVFGALASGDFDADGDDDLVVQDASGAVHVLLMGARQQPVAWDRSIDAGAGWRLQSVGDYDGDGAADVLWLADDAAEIGLYWPEAAAPEYVPLDAGSGWLPVSFQP